MINVIGIVFKENSRIYYFSPVRFDIKKDSKVIVETERGLQYGVAATDIFEIKEENLSLPLKDVIRIADKTDEQLYNENLEESKRAIEQCNKLIKKYNLEMILTDASFTFDRNQLIFHFTSDNRVDFRKLARDLAFIYKTRIELRQIGVRDKAREIGGLGPCGMPICCSSFLKNFDAVSINMAKTQNLALNPNKINGSCGRLLCCLSYENELYQQNRKGMPETGSIIKTKTGEGRVISLDILNRTYKILKDNNELEIVKLD
jgi:cell fate regulator YaaT (PSP1 superfamily)